MNCELKSVEYRAKIQNGILNAIKPLHLKPETASLVEAIARGEIYTSVMLGETEARAFQKAGLLYPLFAVGGDFKKDGWEDILRSSTHLGNKILLRRWRVTENRLVAPGEIIIRKTDDVIKLSVATEDSENDYTRWFLGRRMDDSGENHQTDLAFNNRILMTIHRVDANNLPVDTYQYRGRMNFDSALEIQAPVLDGESDVLHTGRGEYGELVRESDGQPTIKNGSYQAKFLASKITSTFPESLIGSKYIIF